MTMDDVVVLHIYSTTTKDRCPARVKTLQDQMNRPTDGHTVLGLSLAMNSASIAAVFN